MLTPNRCRRFRCASTFALTLLLVGPARAGAADEERSPAELAPPGEAAAVPAAKRASTEAAPAGPVRSELFERVRVVGAPDRSARIPGSVTYLDVERLAHHEYTDINRVLSLVPGVNIQEEEGYGLRPNIGLRGTGSERSSKVTLMEDGVLVAPAPYAAPSAYYFPTTGRMEGVEVRKGSSSIQQGPYTNGGVLNLLSSAIPSEFSGTVRMALGEDDTLRGRFKIGGSGPRFGWLVETYRFDTEGFKRLDGGGPTGVELDDYLVKLRFQSGAAAARFQALEVKLGRTDQTGHETYLGLAEEDFERTPYRRYAASREDILRSDHEQAHLRWLLRVGPRFDLTTTVYRNDFFRNWRKLGKVDGGAGFVDIGDVLADPFARAAELAILRGADSAADALNVRNNRRDYYAQGVHTVLGIHPGGAGSKHDLEVGLRLHQDEEDRFQEEDLFRMASGRMLLTLTGAPGSQSNRINRADALAMHVQDTVSLGRWTVTPGLRFEHIEFERLDYGKNDPDRTGFELARRDNDVDEVIPGVGVTYELTPSSRLLAGVHRGFAPPGPGADRDTEPEESINWEAGYRRTDGALDLQVVGFYSHYDNLLGADTLSAGGTGEGDLFNGGEVVTRGVEAELHWDLGTARDSGLSVPLGLAYTYTQAEFRSSFASDFEPWGTVRSGDELPYVPRHQATLEAGVAHSRWTLFGNLIYRDRMRTEAGQGRIPPDSGTDSYVLLDLSASYRLRPELEAFVQVRNATDEVYVSARRPAGARPGLPRTVMAGLSFEF